MISALRTILRDLEAWIILDVLMYTCGLDAWNKA